MSRIAVSLLWVSAVPALASIPVQYKVTDLGTLGGDEAIAYDVNDGGIVVGYSSLSGLTGSHGFLYDGAIHDLGTLDGPYSVAYGINNSGQTAGYTSVESDGSISHGFLLDAQGFQNLDTLGGDFSYAYSLNAQGQVTGEADLGDNRFTRHAFLYNGTIHDLGTLGGHDSAGYRINDLGHVTGYSHTVGDTIRHAFLYDGVMHDLGTLGGNFSSGAGINIHDQVAGYSDLAGGSSTHAFVYDGTIHDIGTLGGDNSYGLDINDLGQVSGSAQTLAGGFQHAFLYTPGSGMVDLNLLINPQSGWELTAAEALNNVGEIVGVGRIAGQFHPFLLTPIPEPSSLAIAVVGAVGIAAVARRQRPFHRHKKCDVYWELTGNLRHDDASTSNLVCNRVPHIRGVANQCC